jgi:hypothetical protein
MVYVITVGCDVQYIRLWVRRTRIPRKKPNMHWPAGVHHGHVLEALGDYRPYYPKRQVPEWTWRGYLKTHNTEGKELSFPCHMLRITRIPHERREDDQYVTFNEAYDLLCTHVHLKLT